MVFTCGRRQGGKRGDVSQRVHTASYKMDKFWEANILHVGYN